MSLYSGLTSYWKLDESSGSTVVYDYIGNVTGTPTNIIFNSEYATFIASNFSVINFGQVYDYNGSEPFSICLDYWTAGGVKVFPFLAINTNMCTGPVNIALSQTTLQIAIYGDACHSPYKTIDKFFYGFPHGAWHNIILTYDGSSNANGVNVYLDRVKQSGDIISNSLTIPTSGVTNYCSLGLLRGGTYLDGKLKNVGVWNRELSEAEITATTALNAGTIAANQTICYNGNPAAFTSVAPASGGTTDYTYQWQYSTDSGSTWNDISGAGSTTYDSGTLTATRWFRRRVIDSGSPAQTGYTNTLEVTVYPALYAGEIATNQSVCSGTAPALLTSVSDASGASGTYIYQWQYSTNGVSYSNIAGATSATYQPPALTQTTYYKRRVYDTFCGIGGADYSNVVEIDVKMSPIISAGQTETLTSGSPDLNHSILLDNFTNPSDNVRFTWDTPTMVGVAGGTARLIPSTADLSDILTGDGTCTYYITPYKDGCTGDTESIIIYVNAPTVYATVSSTNVTCNGANDGTITFSNQSGATFYEYSIDGGSGFGSAASFTSLAAGVYNCWIRDVFDSYNKYNVNSALYITQPDVLSANVSSTNVTCNGANDGTITFYNQSGGYGTYEYSIDGGSNWQSSASFTLLAAGDYYLIMRDAAQPTCYVIINTSLQITQPNILDAGVIGNAQSIPINTAPAQLTFLTAPSGGGGTLTYQWLSGTTTADDFIAGATGSTYQPPALTGDTYYRCLITDTVCSQTATTLTIVINVYGALKPPFCAGSYWTASGSTCGNSDGKITITDLDYFNFYDFTLTDIDGNSYTFNSTTGEATGLTSGYYFLTATVKPAYWYYYGRETCTFEWLEVEDSDTTMANTGVSVRNTICGGFGKQQGRIAYICTDSGANPIYTAKLYNKETHDLVQTVTGSTIDLVIFVPLTSGDYYCHITNSAGCSLLIGSTRVEGESLRSVAGIKRLWLTRWDASVEYDYWAQSDEDYYLASVDADFFNSIKIKRFVDATLPDIWYSVNVQTKGITFQQKMNKTKQGFVFTDTLTLTIPEADNTKWKELVDILQHQYILIFLDNNGDYWCMGYRHGANVDGYKRENNEYILEFNAISESKILTNIDKQYVIDSIL